MKQSMEADGFSVDEQEAGILLRATPEKILAIKKNSKSLYTELPIVLDKLVDFIKAYRFVSAR